jgi:hypothetical protein
MRDAYFLPWTDEEHGWATLFSISRTGGGGGAGVQPETRTGDGLMFGIGWETLLHEFGHTMPQVPDEYTASGEWSGGNCWEGANTTGETFRENIPWRNWIEEDTPLPTPYTEEYLDHIGAFEGALTNYFGCHRPTARGCYMGAGGFGPGYGLELCAPCRQRVVCQLYRYVDVIENPIPANTDISIDGPETINFSADFVKPEPNTQVYSWYLNGELIAQGVEEIEVDFGLCNTYELTLTVEDTTSWVRYDEDFDHIYRRPFASRTWLIDQTETNQNSLSGDITPTPADCSGQATGQVDFLMIGGTPPYQAWYNGQNVGLQHTELEAGIYEYWITDANGCGIQGTVEVESTPLLEVGICSEFDQLWSAAVEIEGYDLSDLSIAWSNGDSGVSMDDVAPGDYSVSVTTPDLCTITHEFTLDSQSSANPLNTSHTAFNSGAGLSNGAIYVEVDGGQPDYTIQWYDRYARDLTNGDPALSDASGSNFGHLPEMAFDNDLNTKWLQAAPSNIWIRFSFPDGKMITEYTITSGDDVEERDPTSWLLQGSFDGNNWTTLDTRNGEDFEERRQQKGYNLNNTTAYNFYRLLILANSGADATQLQEIELIGTDENEDFTYRPEFDNQWSRINLPTGDYRYEVNDGLLQCSKEVIPIISGDAFIAADLIVIQESECSVAIENPEPGHDYVWYGDEEGLLFLHSGTSFSPPYGGNFWVAAIDQNASVHSQNLKGFAVTMPDQPEVAEISNGILGIVDPKDELEYHWYTEECGEDPIHIGNEFSPTANQTYYVSAWWADPFPNPKEPTQVPGFMLKMDAADLNGNGIMDNPTPATSSLYDWSFTPGGAWEGGSWFAFRGNAQNGLGIVDFGTMWLQCFSPALQGYQTVIMAYEENPLSWKGSAPFFGMDTRMPYSAEPENALYSEAVPASTLNGDTWLNGALVNPTNTPNPLEFCVLGQTFTDPVGWTDCTDTHWEGKLGEILFFEDELEEDDMKGITEYLRRKWISTADLESRSTPIEWEGAVSVYEASNTEVESIHLYPNPTSQTLFFELDNEWKQETLQARILDIHGRIVQTEVHAFSNRIMMNLEELVAGTYLLEVMQNDKRKVGRFVVK